MADTIELRPGEEKWAETKGDSWESPETIKGQISGKFYFTNQRVIFKGGGLIAKLRHEYEFKIAEIASIKKFSVSFIIPTGIKVTMKDGGKYKISVLGRGKYFTKLNELIGRR